MIDEPYVDEWDEPDSDLNRITNAIIGACIEVHKRLGPGYLEAYYERTLACEFEERLIPFRRQAPFAVTCKDCVIGEGFLDFLVEDKIVVELKSVESLLPLHRAQVISYLKATQCKLALLINFNVRLLRQGIVRIAY